MYYQQFRPSAALEPYVLTYYVWEHDPMLTVPLKVHSPPNGLTALVFNYGNPYDVSSAPGQWSTAKRCFLAGQFRKNYTLRLSGRIGMIGVVLWPTALARLLSVPAIEVTDQRIDLSLLLGKEASWLMEQISQATSHSQRLGILERFLLEKIRYTTFQPDVTDHALHTILRRKGILSIRQLSDELCISPRQLRRRFTEKIGVSPKLFSRIKRFSYISNLSTTDFSNWLDMTHQGGYYDQAHFIRDFCDFSGQSPVEFVNYNRAITQLLGA